MVGSRNRLGQLSRSVDERRLRRIFRFALRSGHPRKRKIYRLLGSAAKTDHRRVSGDQGSQAVHGKTGGVARYLIYPKGAYILHMLRMMMYQTRETDMQFQAMMHDFVKSYFNKDVSTEDFKRIVEKHMTKEMDIDHNGKMDWFFDEWVYGTEVPGYQFDYQIASDGTISGKVTQSGVSDKFVMLVPIYLDFGKGWIKLGTVTMAGNSSVDLG